RSMLTSPAARLAGRGSPPSRTNWPAGCGPGVPQRDPAECRCTSAVHRHSCLLPTERRLTQKVTRGDSMPDRPDRLERAIQSVLELCDLADRLRAGKTGRDAKALEVFADEVRSRVSAALDPSGGEE